MKRLLVFAVAALIITSCKQPEKKQKSALQEILSIHEKVMDNEQKLMDNKLKIDTLLKSGIGADLKQKGTALSTKMEKTDDAMGDWMQKFDPDYKGKSGDEADQYYRSQLQKVKAVDSAMDADVNESNRFLSQFKKK